MVSWTIYLTLFFNIITIDIQSFAVASNQYEKNTQVKLGALSCKELSHILLHLSIVLEVTSQDCGFECKE